MIPSHPDVSESIVFCRNNNQDLFAVWHCFFKQRQKSKRHVETQPTIFFFQVQAIGYSQFLVDSNKNKIVDKYWQTDFNHSFDFRLSS